jgi:hypothetical protein
LENGEAQITFGYPLDHLCGSQSQWLKSIPLAKINLVKFAILGPMKDSLKKAD